MNRPRRPAAVSPAALAVAAGLLVLAAADAHAEAQRFDATALKIERLRGEIDIAVGGTGIEVETRTIEGDAQELTVQREGDAVVIRQRSDSYATWFSFGWFGDSDEGGRHVVTVRLPEGTPVSVEGFIGRARIGDIRSALSFGGFSAEADIGDVKAAAIRIAGDGKVRIETVETGARLNIAGDGEISIGDAGSVDLAGDGRARIGAIDGGLKIDVAGDGDVEAQRVNGPFEVSVAGDARVMVAEGRADPLRVSVAGSADINFGGTASTAKVSGFGDGKVRVRVVEGPVDTSGMITFRTGD